MKKTSRKIPQPAAPEPVWPSRLAALSLVLFCLVLGFILYDNSAKTGFWYDELWSLDAVGGGISRMLQLLQSDFHPPGYHLLLYGWVRLFGTSETAARSLSMLFLIGTLPVTYFLGLSLGLGRAAAVLGAGLTCFINGTFGFGIEARPYAMLLFLTTLALLFLARSSRSRSAFWISAGVGVLAIYSHYAALFILFPATLLFALQDRDKRILWLAPLWTVSLLPWGLQIISQAKHFKQVGWLTPPTWALALGYLDTDFGFSGGRWLAALIMAAAVLETLRRGGFRQRLWLFLPVVVGVGTAIVSYLIIPIFHLRYFLPALPFAGLAVGFLIDRLRPLQLRWAIAIIGPLAAGVFVFNLHKADTVKEEDWRGAAQFALSHPQDATLIVTTERSRFFRHYIPGIVILPEENQAAVDQWIQKTGAVKVWFLQARQYAGTPASRTVAQKSEIVSINDFTNARTMLLELRP